VISKIGPKQVWEILQNNSSAVLVDVRSHTEYAFVGHTPNALHIPWKKAPDWTVNPYFVKDIDAVIAEKDTLLILMCRNGCRSMQAALALEQNGYTNLFNMDEGFEGDMDDNQHRGTINGWRFHKLPWQQS
jgi:rhodanese-related sulfurtransferase